MRFGNGAAAFWKFPVPSVEFGDWASRLGVAGCAVVEALGSC